MESIWFINFWNASFLHIFQPFEVVSKFLDDVYSGLMSNELQLDIGPDLANVFAMLAAEEQIVDEEMVETVEIPGKIELVENPNFF